MRYIEMESERLLYRKFTGDDFSMVLDWLGNSENIQYRRGEPRSEDQVRDYINWAISNAEAEECTNYEYAVVLKTSHLLIGSATLMNLPQEPEIGWTLHRNFWRQGYGTEMGQALLRLGFDALNLRRMIAGCNAENQGSYKIMEAIGMRREARFVKAKRGGSALGHKWCDRLQYAILQEEWRAMQ